MKRILYLKSTEDEYEVQENEYLKSKLLREEYLLEYFFMMNFQNKPQIIYADLLERLEKKISSFQPDYIALHTGTAFNFYPSVILMALAIIKNKYQKIIFIFQPLKYYFDYEKDYNPYLLLKEDEYGKKTEQMYMWLLKDKTIFETNTTINQLLW
jgi:hypothetical protein